MAGMGRTVENVDMHGNIHAFGFVHADFDTLACRVGHETRTDAGKRGGTHARNALDFFSGDGHDSFHNARGKAQAVDIQFFAHDGPFGSLLNKHPIILPQTWAASETHLGSTEYTKRAANPKLQTASGPQAAHEPEIGLDLPSKRNGRTCSRNKGRKHDQLPNRGSPAGRSSLRNRKHP